MTAAAAAATATEHVNPSSVISSGALVVMFMIFSYMLLGALLEKYHCRVGHEASILVLLGGIISTISYSAGLLNF